MIRRSMIGPVTGIRPPRDHISIRGSGMLIILLFFGIIMPALALAGVISPELVNMFGRYMAFAVAAVGLDLIWGYTGILSLAQFLFFALGGYAVGIYLTFQGTLFNGIPEALYVVYPYAVGQSRGSEILPWFWVPFRRFIPALFLGLTIPAAVAALIGYVGFRSRVKGVYFSILTQALTAAAALFFSKNENFFAGTNGLTHFKTILGLELTAPGVKVLLYFITFLMLIASFFTARKITRTKFGRILIAVRDNESRLRFSGYKPHLYKTAIFAFAAALAALGGILYTPQANIITPSFMEARWSILMVIWAAVGGRGTLIGAAAGALVVNLLYNLLTSQFSIGPLTWSPAYWPIVLGLIFILVVLAFPRGLHSACMGLTDRIDHGIRRIQSSSPRTRAKKRGDDS